MDKLLGVIISLLVQDPIDSNSKLYRAVGPYIAADSAYYNAVYVTGNTSVWFV